MIDNVNKIEAVLLEQDEAWWTSFTNAVNSDDAIRRMAPLLSSLGLTVSDDAGVLQRARELANGVYDVGILMPLERQFVDLFRDPQPAPVAGKEAGMTFAWVIERDESEPSRPEYFTGKSHPALRWSNPGDHEAAIRFARRVDAERMALAVDGARRHRVAEHGWDEFAGDDMVGPGGDPNAPHQPTRYDDDPSDAPTAETRDEGFEAWFNYAPNPHRRNGSHLNICREAYLAGAAKARAEAEAAQQPTPDAGGDAGFEAIWSNREQYETWKEVAQAAWSAALASAQSRIDALTRERDHIIGLLSEGDSFEKFWKNIYVLYPDWGSALVNLHERCRRAWNCGRSDIIRERDEAVRAREEVNQKAWWVLRGLGDFRDGLGIEKEPNQLQKHYLHGKADGLTFAMNKIASAFPEAGGKEAR